MPDSPEPAPSEEGPAQPAGAEQLFTILYEDLRSLARQRMALERPGHSLQATALVHEAYLRIGKDRPEGWVSRGQFFAAAAEAMRRIMVENARSRRSLRNGGDQKQRLSLNSVDLAIPEPLDDVLALEEVFGRFEQADPRCADVVRLRFFAGLNEEEVAAALGLSTRTVRREWVYARAWLFDALNPTSRLPSSGH